jgi:hypothetical protein
MINDCGMRVVRVQEATVSQQLFSFFKTAESGNGLDK